MKERLKSLIKFGIFTSIALYAVNKFIESSALTRNLLKTNAYHYYNWKDGAIYYEKHGSGSPILLIHDLDAASSMQEWTKVIDLLSADHTVYAVDLPGCGRSEKDAIAYTNYYFVQFVTDFIQDIIKEKTDIAATGMSSSFVIMAASMHKNIIGKITMINPRSPKQLAIVPDKKSSILMRFAAIPIISTSVYYMETSMNQIEYDFTEKYIYNPFHVSTKMLHTYYEAAHRDAGKGKYLTASIKTGYINVNINAALSKLDNEIQILCGSHFDNAVQIADAYQKIQPSITYHVIDKTKYLLQIEAPEKAAKYILSSN